MGKHLMGPGEIRERMGRLSRQRVYQITSHPTFPKPYDELRMGKVWRIEDVEAWIREHLRGRDG
jgi:predicted DNA-binding transcriptional regulator AlpA